MAIFNSYVKLPEGRSTTKQIAIFGHSSRSPISLLSTGVIRPGTLSPTSTPFWRAQGCLGSQRAILPYFTYGNLGLAMCRLCRFKGSMKQFSSFCCCHTDTWGFSCSRFQWASSATGKFEVTHPTHCWLVQWCFMLHPICDENQHSRTDFSSGSPLLHHHFSEMR